MPDLDVSDVLLDPDLAATFTVTRRPLVVNDYGEATVPAPQTIAGVIGVVCRASPSDLARLPEAQRMASTISIVTKFRLRGPSVDGADQEYHPDVVNWQNSAFVVQLLDPYTHYGQGFVQAIAQSMDSVDRAPE